jgi:hypothetical protein
MKHIQYLLYGALFRLCIFGVSYIVAKLIVPDQSTAAATIVLPWVLLVTLIETYFQGRGLLK